jgi:excisionase family DNA binding protein
VTKRLPYQKTARADELRRAAEACEDALRRAFEAQGLKLAYRPETVASLLDTPLRTVRAWIDRGDLRAFHIGRSLYVHRRDLAAFVERHRGQ